MIIASLYALLGDKESAFKWLEKAFQQHPGDLLFLKVNRHFDSLRSDPRFQDLMRRVGFPQ